LALECGERVGRRVKGALKNPGAFVATLLACLPAASVAGEKSSRQWYSLSIDGQRVGYGWHERRASGAARIDTQVLRVYVTQLRHVSVVETTTEIERDEQGTPKSIRVAQTNGVDRRGWKGAIAANGRSMRVTTTGSRTALAVPLPADLVWPDELEQSIERLAAAGRTSASIQMLDTGTATATLVQVQRAPDGGRWQLQLASALPDTPPRMQSLWLDSRHRVVAREQAFMSTTLRREDCDRDCDARVAQPYDVMARLVVTPPYRVPAGAREGPIRYVLSRSDGGAPAIPVTAEQDVVMDGGKAVVTICRTCGKAARFTDAERRAYLAPNRWVQSDAPEVRDFARLNSGRGPPAQVMAELVEAIRKHMSGGVDYLGYASATQALESRAGDCTEFAVLLAAAARARGIPARITSGLVYADRFSGKKDVFSPHTWVQAWIGDRWVSFDAGLGSFDATHIALAVGDGDPRHVPDAGTGQWHIEKLGLVK
jgi:hypothetical protein